MSKTPGFILPSTFPLDEALKESLRELKKRPGFMELDNIVEHSSVKSDPTRYELSHQGVKGMKWGVRRAEANAPNSGYSQYHKTEDKKVVGRSGVKKINRRMNKGEEHKIARSKVLRNQAMRKLAVAGAIYALPHILDISDKTVGSIAQRAQTKRGQSAMANSMGLPRKPTNGPTYSKKKRGVHKITTL